MQPSRHVADASEFLSWLKSSRSGDVCTYFRGNLAKTRQQLLRGGGKRASIRREEVDTLASTAMDYSDRGLVHLLQRRGLNSDGRRRMDYLAVRASSRRAQA